MAEATGLSAVLADIGVGDAIAPPEPEQLDLLGLRPIPDARRGRGRPPGARNKSVQEIAGYLLSRYADPLEGLVQMANMGVDELAAALSCTQAEAWSEKRLCIIAALPYLHRRQPLAVDVTTKTPVYLTLHMETGDGAAGLEGLEVLPIPMDDDDASQ